MREIIFGFIAGIISSLGMGGGTVLIVLFNIFSKIYQHTIQSINLFFFIPTAISACFINIKNKFINWIIIKDIIIFGVIGAIIGSLFAIRISNFKLKKIFGVFILIIALFQIYEIYTSYNRKKNVNNKVEYKN